MPLFSGSAFRCVIYVKKKDVIIQSSDFGAVFHVVKIISRTGPGVMITYGPLHIS